MFARCLIGILLYAIRMAVRDKNDCIYAIRMAVREVKVLRNLLRQCYASSVSRVGRSEDIFFFAIPNGKGSTEKT